MRIKLGVALAALVMAGGFIFPRPGWPGWGPGSEPGPGLEAGFGTEQVARAERAVQPMGWVAGGEIGALTLYRDGERDAVIKAQLAAHLNTLYVTVKQFDGRLWYYTDEFPHLMATPGPSIKYTRTDNPLTRILDAAHTARPKIAVMVLFQAFNDVYAARELFPEARIGDMDWVDPAYRPMQDYLIKVAEDLVANYPIDGISLDMIRYPAGVSDHLLPYTQGRSRVEVITGFVDRFARAMHQIDPTVDVSMSTFAETTSAPQTGIGQDIGKLKDVVDFISPMLYPYTDHAPGDGEMLRNYQEEHVRSALSTAGDPDRIKPAIQGFFGYTFDDVGAQIEGARKAGATGVLVYAYDFDMGWDPDEWAVLAKYMPVEWWKRNFRADPTPPVIAGVKNVGAAVAWETDELTTGVVEYGETEARGRVAESASAESALTGRFTGKAAAPARQHFAVLTGLKPGQTYHYRVKAVDLAGHASMSEDRTFRYKAPKGGPPAISWVKVSEVNDVWALFTWRTAGPAGTAGAAGSAGDAVAAGSAGSAGDAGTAGAAGSAGDAVAAGSAGSAADAVATESAGSAGAAVPVAAVVEYGADTRYGSTLPAWRTETGYQARATDLAGGKTYHFRIRVGDGYGRETISKDFTFDTPQNLAQGRPAKASSVVHAGFEADKAVDGSIQKRWCSRMFSDDPEWLSVDLERVQTISRVGLEWEYAYARAYAVQVSADGETWQTVFATEEGNGGREDVLFKPVAARYARVLMTRRGTNLGYSLWEVKVYR